MKLNKRLLRKIPVIEFNNDWLGLVERIKDTLIDYIISVQNEKVGNEDIVILNIFNKEKPEKVSFRVFSSKYDYITQDLTSDKAKWRTGNLGYILGSPKWYKWSILADDNSCKLLKEFLDTNDNPLLFYSILQSNIMDDRLNRRHQKLKDKIDEKMATVPELPADFKEWVDNIALFHSRYIYYEYKKRKMLKGYCTHCSTDVEVERAKVRHNKKGVCPNCSSPITFKAIGKSKYVYDTEYASIIQKAGDELVVRYFFIRKYYQDYRNPDLMIYETTRDFIDKKYNFKSYQYRNFLSTNEIRWSPAISTNHIFATKDLQVDYAVLYTNNLDDALKGTTWEYSALKEFASHSKGYSFNIFIYLNRYKHYPQLEYLVKLRLYKIVDDIVNTGMYGYYATKNVINLKGRNLHEVLGIDKERVNFLRKINGGIKELETLQKAYKHNLKLTEEEIRYISSYNIADEVVELAEYTTVNKIIKYIEKQAHMYIKNNKMSYAFVFEPYKSALRDVAHDWLDYIDCCRGLGHNIRNEFVLFPRDLKKSHDEVVELIEVMNLEEKNKIIASMYKELYKMFTWRHENNVIIVPKTANEILKEGDNLKHCVKKYIDKVIKGNCIILFLRKADNISKSYYTIELDPKTYDIRQCRGYSNKGTDDNVRKVLDKFKKERLMKLTQKKIA